MALRHEPFEECRCCDKAAADIELYKREILAASATVDVGGRTFVVVPEVKAEIERLREIIRINHDGYRRTIVASVDGL